MRKETKIGNTNYIVNGSYRAVGDGVSLSAALFRLMEKDLQTGGLQGVGASIAQTIKGDEKVAEIVGESEQYFAKAIEPIQNLRYNNLKSQNNFGCELQAKKEVLV